jgi:dTDP-4-amino-4,6-dideoxygalactose transaminase
MTVGTGARIPLSLPYIDSLEEELVLEVLRSGRLSLGAMVTRFEEELARSVSAEHAAAVSSGTAGLHLCTRLAGIRPGDEVITSPFSFVASANCVLYEGATPVFADIDGRTLNLDPNAVEAAVTDRTRAIVAVDIFGYPCDIDELRSICDRHELVFIEDACESLGAEYKGRPIGSHGHLAVFAFYPNKQITTGEGGIVVTGDKNEWRLLKSLSNQGRSDSGGWLEHARFGYNYRLSDLAAAVGAAQLMRLDEILALRSAAAARYADLLADVHGVEPPLADGEDYRRSWFVYPARLSEEVDRERVIATLADAGIETSRYLPSIHLQPYMRERFGFREGMFPVSEEASKRLLALPFYSSIDEADQERVVDTLRRALG